MHRSPTISNLSTYDTRVLARVSASIQPANLAPSYRPLSQQISSSDLAPYYAISLKSTYSLILQHMHLLNACQQLGNDIRKYPSNLRRISDFHNSMRNKSSKELHDDPTAFKENQQRLFQCFDENKIELLKLFQEIMQTLQKIKNITHIESIADLQQHALNVFIGGLLDVNKSDLAHLPSNHWIIKTIPKQHRSQTRAILNHDINQRYQIISNVLAEIITNYFIQQGALKVST